MLDFSYLSKHEPLKPTAFHLPPSTFHWTGQHQPGLTVPFQNVGRLLVLSLGTSGCCTCPLVSILLTLFIIFLKTFGCFFTRFRVSFGSFLRLKRYNSLDFFAWYIDWANSDFVSLLSTWDLMPSGYPHINFQSLYLNNFISNY